MLSKGRERSVPCPDMTSQPVFGGRGQRSRGSYEEGVLKATGRANRVKPVQTGGPLFVVIVSTLQRVDVSEDTRTRRRQ